LSLFQKGNIFINDINYDLEFNCSVYV